MKIGIFDSGIGAIPFVNEIIEQKKENDYSIFLDQSFFPYGDKTIDQLALRLIDVFKYFEKRKITHLLLLCNTMSYVYLKTRIPSSFSVDTILEFNLKKYDKSCCLIGTEFLYKKLKDRMNIISGKNLATLIEKGKNEEIEELIQSFKLKKRTILSCTHYPMVKNVFKKCFPNIAIDSYEKDFIFLLSSSTSSSHFEVNKKGSLIVTNFFPLLRMKIIND